MSIKRYAIYEAMDELTSWLKEEEDGELVQYADHAPAIAKKDEEIAKLCKLVEDVAGFYAASGSLVIIQDGGRKALAALAELDAHHG